MTHKEVKTLLRNFRLARSECSRLGATLMEIRAERDALRRRVSELEHSHQDLLSWGYELARRSA